MIVTISNEYGAGAIEVANLLAQRLGYDVVDRQLPVVVAKRMSVTPDQVEATEDAGRTLGERLLSSLEIATPELAQQSSQPSFDRAAINALEEAVREFAASGDVVIVGRGAGAILGRRSDVVRVFMHAPRDWRTHRIMETFALDERVASAEVDRVDRARRAHLRDWYGANFGEAQNYDLSIDTSTFGVESSARIIAAAIRERG